MFAIPIALALSGQLLAPQAVKPGMSFLEVVKLVGECPEGLCNRDPNRNEFVFERSDLWIVVNREFVVISVRRK